MPEAQGAPLTTFESHPPFTDDPVIAQFVTYAERAQRPIPYTFVDLQSAIILSLAGARGRVTATGAWTMLDRRVAEEERGQGPSGTSWNGPQNYVEGSDQYKVKQLQDGKWVVVWPTQWAAPGAKPV